MTEPIYFPFQQEAIDKLAKQQSRLVGDDMGLGKTFTGMGLDLQNRRNLPPPACAKAKTLIITKKSVVPSWEATMDEYADTKLVPNIVVLDPKKRHDFLKDAISPSVGGYFIMHWDALRLMPELQKVKWFHIIADEVHTAKNRKAQVTRALKRLPTFYKTGLSGTPADNMPQDLWSILNWLWPRYYKSYWAFVKHYCESITMPEGYTKFIGVRNAESLHEEMKPWFIRRKKEQVLKELPDKYYTKVWVDLTPQQRRAYNEMKKDLVAWVGEHQDIPLSSPVVVAQLMRLQQFALAYASVDWKQVYDKELGEKVNKPHVMLTEPSSKLDALMDILEGTDGQVVVFSNFKQIIKLLEARLAKRGISYGLLTGDTPQSDRGRLVADFQAGKIQVFAGTIGAGGVGITLTAANTVVFLDRNWSPSQNRQAEDRLHRIGQKSAVQVIDIMARNTVDLGRHQKIELKQTWLNTLLGDSTIALQEY